MIWYIFSKRRVQTNSKQKDIQDTNEYRKGEIRETPIEPKGVPGINEPLRKSATNDSNQQLHRGKYHIQLPKIG